MREARDPAPAELDLPRRYRAVRATTARLVEPLSAEDCALQSMDDASPAKWHLAHTSWYFETFVLESAIAGYRPFHPAFRVLFNSYYNAVGEQHPRPRRGLLSRPTLDDVLAYRAHVDRHMAVLLDKGADLAPELREVILLGTHHEEQHQELLLTDVKHLFSCNPLEPAYRELAPPPRQAAPPHAWIRHAEGLRQIGHAGAGFAFDNEGPAHRCFVPGFEIGSRLVTNAEYLAFVEAGGYEDPAHWLADGYTAVRRNGWRAPGYWRSSDAGWQVLTLGGPRPLAGDEPVCHVSFYEADAYSRCAGCRLPTEAEWETAAASVPIRGNFAESDLLHPAPAPEGSGPVQMFGDVWEWTASPYVPYPGFRPPAGALGEYNGKFMSNQLVLRGGSCVTPQSHIRASYRNFFYPDARWQFSGIRLARDA